MELDKTVIEKIKEAARDIRFGSIEVIINSDSPYVDVLVTNKERIYDNADRGAYGTNRRVH
ncbi:DUF2292 domain-containing protein [Leadbettera azotonutricia]|uniref:Uncharacterized protein n=1 Tax=Leadbettera azotonutricia (strain ATCC BAA-888 / DSM 13862 / ZAS-9) TaxID=545695 RepID=F5YF70_LEAAZ|nr:DUF2292 domain-containing protein [Leadbettera azotonutricia]AEF80659.1 hypothetical protein TREAZ_2493 [Leadbettera azotonutricia ZAS-9]